MRQSSLQLEKEGEQKIEKLNNQMDGIIRRTDKEIKNLKNEEANLKKIISDRDEVVYSLTLSSGCIVSLCCLGV